LKSRVDILNRSFDISAIATEWELVVLNAFSKLGNVSYEKKLGGISEIDVYFQLNKFPKIFLIADITAVTDEGYEKNNPIKQFYKKVRKFGLLLELCFKGHHIACEGGKKKVGRKGW